MPDNRAFRIKITFTGAAAFLPLLIFVLPGGLKLVPIIAAAAAPALAILSFVLLAVFSRSLKLTAEKEGKVFSSLFPEEYTAGKPINIERRFDTVGFYPGVNINIYWKLRFGPYKYNFTSYSSKGAEKAVIKIPVRGRWSIVSGIAASDPFGFFKFYFKSPSEGIIHIFPDIRELSGNEIPSADISGKSCISKRNDNSDEKMERRAYFPGDDPRKLDWKLYARSGELMIKTGQENAPEKGKVRLIALSPYSAGIVYFTGKLFFRRPVEFFYKLLDQILVTTVKIEKELKESSMDVFSLLPGEKRWQETITLRRAASCEIQPFNTEQLPPGGEKLWITAFPGRPAVNAAAAALEKGCRVTLCFPESVFNSAADIKSGYKTLLKSGSGFSLKYRLFEKFYIKKLESVKTAATSGGIDVRII